jgi:ABC-type branched-subunit amino acid transport system ATPase component
MTGRASLPAALLDVSDVAAGYGDVDILDGVTVRVGEGEIVTIIGPNGAGKSTLLRVVTGLLAARRGRIVFEGENITNRRPSAIVARGIAYVPQTQNVFPSLSVEENLEMGAYLRAGSIAERLHEIYRRFPVLSERRRQPAGSLSGGERQMAAIAQALMLDPRLLVLDEPSAGLAPAVVESLFERLREINREGVALLMVEQNAREALSVSDRGYVMVMGRNRAEGPGRELARDPEVRATFLGA